MENQFYETVKLPKSPYTDPKRQETYSLPSHPPRYSHGEEETVERGTRRAEEFMDKLIDLNNKRRGVPSSAKRAPKNATLNLSG